MHRTYINQLLIYHIYSSFLILSRISPTPNIQLEMSLMVIPFGLRFDTLKCSFLFGVTNSICRQFGTF